VLSRADMVDEAVRSQVHARVESYAPHAIWCEVEHRVVGLLNSGGQRVEEMVLAGKRVAAFCGIGNPAGFRHTLGSLGCDIVAWREFPDHHNYTREDVASLSQWAQQAEAIVCTRKDLVKLCVPTLGGVALWAANVEIGFLAGQAELERTLAEVVTQCSHDAIDTMP
jgi:tetraacyldisaccharide 4'-kinase